MKFFFYCLLLAAPLMLFGCSDSGRVELPMTNNTRIGNIDCNSWYHNENMYKSSCFIDNADSAEQRPIRIVAFNDKGAEIGDAFIGRATIGMKVKVNKAMLLQGKPSTLTLEAVD